MSRARDEGFIEESLGEEARWGGEDEVVKERSNLGSLDRKDARGL